jgi:hypothetical protein
MSASLVTAAKLSPLPDKSLRRVAFKLAADHSQSTSRHTIRKSPPQFAGGYSTDIRHFD